MSLIIFSVSYFLQNGLTADDLGLLLVGGAVLILMIGVTCRAVRVLSEFLIIPAADLYLNMLVGVVLGQEDGEPAEVEDPLDRAPDDPFANPEA